MNIYDIAKKAGVSIATVSRVLNNSARVSEATRQRVLEAVEEEDYKPNVFARGLMLNTMKTVGLMCQDASDPYMGAAINYLEAGLRGRDYEMLLCCTGPDPEDKQKRLSQLLARKVDAVILIGSSFVEKTEEENRYLYQAAQQVPILFLNGILNGENIYGCMSDDYKAVKHAVSYALGTGCRSPLFLYRADTMSAGRKKAGFISAIEDAGIPFSERMCCLSGRNAREAAECLKALRQNHGVFDLVMAADDELAVGAVKYALETGIRIPEDISIIGYNNSYLAQCCTPELTSVDNHLRDMCGSVVDMLMKIFEKEEIPHTTVIPGELIMRGTTSR